MALDVGDAVLTITGDSKELDKALQEVDSKVKASAENWEASFTKAGAVMFGAGSALLAGLGMTVKAAEEERVGIVKLESALKNVGVAYDDVAESLEANIAAMKRKTGVDDAEQRDSLRKLVIITGDYNEALKLLPLAMDMASAMDMNLVGASQLLGRVMEGNTGVLRRYGIILKEGATSAEALAAIQAKVGGSAEAAASPLKIMAGSLEDLSETIGGALLPAFNELLDKNIIPFVDKMTEWIKLNPEAVKGIALLAAGLIGAGGLIFAMRMLSGAIIAVNTALIIMQSLTGVGILKVIAGLAVAGASIFAMNELMKGGESTGGEYELKSGKMGSFAEWEKENLPSFAGFEGKIPGIPGTPMLATVHAGEYIGQGGGGSVLNVNIGTYAGDDISMNMLTRRIEEILQHESRRRKYAPANSDFYSVGGHF